MCHPSGSPDLYGERITRLEGGGLAIMARGRPPGQMTHRRRQILAEYARAANRGESPTLAQLARRCGLYDYREARRIMKDLERMGAL